jgi:hypothetical protein
VENTPDSRWSGLLTTSEITNTLRRTSKDSSTPTGF